MSTPPNLALLLRYRRSWLRGDLLAGVTVAAYLVPQVMAYAGLAGLDPVAGLWATMPALLVYAVLGSSRQLSVGPESTTALMTAAVVGPLAGGDTNRYAQLAAALAVVVGAFCLAAWALRLGLLADLLSKPVLVGYMAGVAVIMVAGQLGKLTGIPVTGDTFRAQVRSLLHGLDQVRAGTLAFSVVTLAVLFALQRWARRLPGPLLTVLAATAVVAVFDLERHGIAIVGDVRFGLPHVHLPAGHDLSRLLLPALGVLVVGYTDNVLTARSFAARARDSNTVDAADTIDGNQELLALGGANIGAGLLAGFPVSSSGSRTAVGDAAGSRTQLSSLVTLAAVVGTLIGLSPLLRHFPAPALGALVVYAAVRLVDIAGFRRLAAFRRSEFLLAAAALVGVLGVDILYGVLIAVGLSVADLLRRVARPHDAVQGLVPGLAGMHDVDDYPQARTLPGLVVYRYDSPLFFANAEDFKRRALDAAGSAERLQWFVLNVEANVEVDSTALDAVESVRATLAARGVTMALARVKQDLLDDLERFGLVEALGRDLIFPTLPTAVEAFLRWQQSAP